RYAADPGPATRSATDHLPLRPPPRATAQPSPASRARDLAPPRQTFPADEIPLVRPYFTAHERAADRRTQAPPPPRPSRRPPLWWRPRFRGPRPSPTPGPPPPGTSSPRRPPNPGSVRPPRTGVPPPPPVPRGPGEPPASRTWPPSPA